MPKKKLLHNKKVVLRTALTPAQLAEYMGGTIEWTDNAATRANVVFMKRADVDADYKRRSDDLCDRLDEVTEHIRKGNISREAESAVAYCLQWTIEQMELMQLEQRKLVAWLMEASEEVASIRNAEKGSKGGAAAASITREVREYAERLAKERAPEDGWQSAPQATEAILADVRQFARTKGRYFSSRKVTEWLRDAGIKKGART